MSYYRGIKQTPQNTAQEKSKPQAGIYRVFKHDAQLSKHKAPKTGIYRGVKWGA